MSLRRGTRPALPRRVWLAFNRLTALGFPRRFPIVQFPNLPLIVGLLAGGAAAFLHGDAHFYARLGSFLGLTIWAYEAVVFGRKWVRRPLGFASGVLLFSQGAPPRR